MSQLPLLTAAKLERYDSRDEWLAARRLSIGASDVPGIMGESSFASPWSVWRDKVHGRRTDERDATAEFGNYCEPFIADWVARETGWPLCDPGEFAVYRSAHDPLFTATLDRWVFDEGGPAVLELKTAHGQSAKVWRTNVPTSYKLQVTAQMIATGVHRAYIAVLELPYVVIHWHPVPWHTPTARHIVSSCRRFWRDHVETRVPPPTDGRPPTSAALVDVYPEANGETVDLGADFRGVGERYDRYTRWESRAKKQKEALKNAVKAAVGDATFARLPDGTGFRWSGGNGSRRFTRVEEIDDG